jgi:hypothetical protein
MNAKKLFDDDDVLFPADAENAGDAGDGRPSHVELCEVEPPSTRPEAPAADNYLLRVPLLAVSERELPLLPLDHREGFLLSHVDGESSIETILDVCAMPAEEALELLQNLVERGVVVVR